MSSFSFSNLGYLFFVADEVKVNEDWLQDIQLSVNECFEYPEQRQDVEASLHKLNVGLSEVFIGGHFSTVGTNMRYFSAAAAAAAVVNIPCTQPATYCILSNCQQLIFQLHSSICLICAVNR